MGEKRTPVDWDAVEPHYRAGIRSLKDLGAEFEVSDAAIIKHAKKSGWTRNLKAKIQAKADAAVSAAMVSAEVSAEAKLTESIVIETEAKVQARIRIGHRTDIARTRNLTMKLLSELEGQTDNQELFERLAELMLDPTQEGDEPNSAAQRAHQKRMDALNAALSLSGRTKVAKDLTDTLHKLVALEREAYGIEAVKQITEADEAPTSENEIARRIAFALHKGLQAAQGAP